MGFRPVRLSCDVQDPLLLRRADTKQNILHPLMPYCRLLCTSPSAQSDHRGRRISTGSCLLNVVLASALTCFRCVVLPRPTDEGSEKKRADAVSSLLRNNANFAYRTRASVAN